MSEGLAQGPYVATRVGFEPATSGRKAPNLQLSHHAPLASMLSPTSTHLEQANKRLITDLPVEFALGWARTAAHRLQPCRPTR